MYSLLELRTLPNELLVIQEARAIKCVKTIRMQLKSSRIEDFFTKNAEIWPYGE